MIRLWSLISDEHFGRREGYANEDALFCAADSKLRWQQMDDQAWLSSTYGNISQKNWRILSN